MPHFLSTGWILSFIRLGLLTSLILGVGIQRSSAEEVGATPLAARTLQLSPGDDVQYQLQGMLIEAVPGDVIQLAAGTYRLHQQLDVVADNITIRGAGPDATILSFAGQRTGGQGLQATGNNLRIEKLAIEDTAGNAIKVNGARNVAFIDVRVEWNGPAAPSNGAYGLYPVQCENVLIDRCVARGASDAGIYVGQCRNVIVRSCRAEGNVAGIEIENTVDADVYDNIATNNAGGLLVFDLPGLQLKGGRNIRVFQNRVVKNNHVNFAAPGNMVAGVPSGTGLMVMATDRVEIFDNEIKDNNTSSVALLSFLATERKLKDPEYDPFSEAISIYGNRISGGGRKPTGTLARMLRPVLGNTLPDILFDGITNPERLIDGKLPQQFQHGVYDNGDISFANVNLGLMTPENIKAGKYRVETDATTLAVRHPALPAVQLPAFDKPSLSTNPAVQVYRSLPAKLSAYQLFAGDPREQAPADGVIPYELNTPLFSDYAAKHRFIRLPGGTAMGYQDSGVLTFPEGSLIAKTFSYPRDARDPKQGNRLLETRIEILQDERWFGFSYMWNEEQTDAELTLGGAELDVEWIDEDGQQRAHPYQVPNANQCLDCHSQDKQYVPIGPTAINMNRDFAYSHGHENQLAFLQRTARITSAPDTAQVDALPVWNDTDTGSLDGRARAWLAVNCAHCHNPQGSARTSGLDLRFAQTDAAKYGVWKSPVAAGHGSGGRDYDIVPGKPDESIMLFRLESTDPSIMMPSVAKNVVPHEAVHLVREWIASMGP